MQAADETVQHNYARNEKKSETDIFSFGSGVASPSALPSCIHVPPGKSAEYERNMLEYSKAVRQSWVYACERVKVRTDFAKYLASRHRPGSSLAK